MQISKDEFMRLFSKQLNTDKLSPVYFMVERQVSDEETFSNIEKYPSYQLDQLFISLYDSTLVDSTNPNLPKFSFISA